MRSTSHRATLLALVALVSLAAAVAGCDDSDDSENAGKTEQAKDNGGRKGDGGKQDAGAETVGLPKPKESVAEAEKRIAKTFASGDCEEIAELDPIVRHATDAEARMARCDALTERFKNAEPRDSATYGKGGAVIAYRTPRHLNALLVLDEDGRYHIAFPDAYLPDAELDGKPAKEFDRVAEDAVTALREKDCDAFLDIAHRRYGPGTFERDLACDYVEQNPIALLFENFPDAELEAFGGGPDYAFYGIAGPGAHFTLVLARESDKGLPDFVEPLPDDAPEYALAGVLRTNVAG
jgi:hypothetical protein